MRKTLPVAPGIAAKLTAFIVERHPFAIPAVQHILEECGTPPVPGDPARIESFRGEFMARLDGALIAMTVPDALDPTPGVTAAQRLDQAQRQLRDSCDGFFARDRIS